MKGNKELKELVKQVARTGFLEVTEEKIVEYQDMIGHSTLEELHQLANPNNGEEQRAFYRIHDVAYGVIATITFYVNNSDKLEDRIAEREKEAYNDGANAREVVMQERVDQKQQACEIWQAEAEQYKQDYERAKQDAQDFYKKAVDRRQEIEKLQAEIVALKAKLYDMMTAGTN